MLIGKLVYLAGPIDRCSYEECTEWRDYAKEQLDKEGIMAISPMRAKEFLRQYEKIADRIHEHPLTSDSGITTRDMWDVMRCDAVLFNLLGAKKVSVGTMIEYGWASSCNQPIKPIVTVMEKQGNPHEHPMIRRLSAYRVETLESGLEIIKALFAY